MNELASVMDTVSLPVFALDADAYYVYENELAQDFLGYDPVAITEKRITDLIVYDPVLLLSGFEGLRQRGYFSGGVRYRHRNSSLVDADVNTFRQTLADGTTVFVALVHPLGSSPSQVARGAAGKCYTRLDGRGDAPAPAAGRRLLG